MEEKDINIATDAELEPPIEEEHITAADVAELKNEIDILKKSGKSLKDVALAIKEENTLLKEEATSALDPHVFSQMQVICDSLVKAEALPKGIKSGQQALVIMQRGFEMGLKPLESVTALYMVNGRIQIWGEAMIMALRKKGWRIKWISVCPEWAEVEVSKGDEVYNAKFTLERAETEGRLKKDGSLWTKYPLNMLRFNAIREIIKFSIPDVLSLNNIYIEGDEEVIDSPVALDRVKERRNRIKNNN